MEEIKSQPLPPPPGVISSVKAGFDAIATHMLAILLPILLNLFLWLGPRLSMEKFYRSILPQLIETWRLFGFSNEEINQIVEQNAGILPQLNLFWLVRTIPIGISSLFSNPFSFGNPAGTPLGAPSVMEVTSDANLLGWVFLLILLGWIGGAFYFRLVARLAAPNEQMPVLSAGRAISQTILISIFFAGIALTLGLPVVVFLSLLFQVSPLIGQLAVFILSFMSMWIVIALFFWPHGVFLRGQNAFVSIIASIRLARFTIPNSSMFVLTIFLLGAGLNFLWTIPPKDSWMTLVGILGHAFVTTALLAASFIYYRDMNAWVQAVLDRMKAAALSKQT
jgi:hypothetical protein